MHHQHHLRLTSGELLDSFPAGKKPWKIQREEMEFVAKHSPEIMAVEAPTGTGKTEVEVAILRACQSKTEKPLFLIVPNKTILEQTSKRFPELKVALGRNEHPCLYYEEPCKADEIPCFMLVDCLHRVDQTTGETKERGAIPCPYLWQKYQAKQGGIVLCTMSFYLFVQLFSKEFEEPACLVIDEAHRMAEVVRHSLSYEITDWHLKQSIEMFERIEAEEAKVLKKFLAAIRRIAKARKRPAYQETLLDDDELERLIDILVALDPNELLRKIKEAIRSGLIDRKKDRVILKKMEMLVRDLRRYVHSFEFSLETNKRKPLNYTCAFYKKDRSEKDKVQHKLVIKSRYVAPLIRKILSLFTVAFSATIGREPEYFVWETGIGPDKGKPIFLSLASDFPVDHTRIFMPTDTLNLAMNSRRKQDMTRTLRLIAKTCKRLARKGHRSLVVTISNAEREKFLILSVEENLDAVSYGNGATAKEVATAFKEGKGDTLVGTAANYAEGVDLPKQIAPVIFFLRPGYPNPTSAETRFEEKRFPGGRHWALWNWRVMQQALQVRGRNIRNRSDLGVTFFISQQFRRFLFSALPEWLEKAYRKNMNFEECVKDAEQLLK